MPRDNRPQASGDSGVVACQAGRSGVRNVIGRNCFCDKDSRPDLYKCWRASSLASSHLEGAMGDDGDEDAGDEADAYCELSFSPNVSLIATVRRFVEEFYVKVIRSANVTSRLAV